MNQTKPKPYREYIQSNIGTYTAYQRKALAREPEMTKLLKEKLPGWVDTARPLSVLDIGCGNGNTLHHLDLLFPHFEYFGVDVIEALIRDGQELFADRENITLDVADAHSIDKNMEQRFDLVLLWRVVQGLENWQQAVRAAARLTKPGGRLILSTLLNDADLDIQTIMRDHTAKGVNEVPLRIFAKTPFLSFCESAGMKVIEILPFEIGVDLARPTEGLNTYTVMLEGGHRTQFAGGALVDHWKIVVLEVP